MNNNVEKLMPLVVDPTPINFGSLPSNRSIEMPVLISNPNDKPIIWIADGYEMPWLMLEEATGTLQPGCQKEIKIMVKTSSMRPGNYAAILTLTADVNDDFVSVETPILLTVSSD